MHHIYDQPRYLIAALQWGTTYYTRMYRSTVTGSMMLHRIMNYEKHCQHSTVQHRHYHQPPLACTLDNSISVVKINWQICAFTIVTMLVSCTNDATLNSLAREKGVTVQDVPRDGNCQEEKQVVETELSHCCQALPVSSHQVFLRAVLIPLMT